MSAEPLRWARCPEDGHLHLLGPAQVMVATTQGHARALCGVRLAAEGLTITTGSAALCLTCLAGTDPAARSRPRWAVAPDDDAAHLLLPDSEVPTAVRCGPPPRTQARCGVVIPATVPVHNQPPARTCIQCDRYSLADEHAPGRFARRDD